MAGRKRKSAIAHAWLRERILSGELPPGRRLVLRRVAEELSMSNMPVREACLQLQQEGLVEFESHRGAVVSGLSVAEMVDMIRVIMWNEALAVLESMPLHDTDALRGAADALAEEGLALDADDSEAFILANRRFHSCLVAEAGPPVQGLISDMRITASRGRRAYPTPSMMASVHEDHGRILAAVQGGDRAEVFREMEAHRSNHEREWSVVVDDPSLALRQTRDL